MNKAGTSAVVLLIFLLVQCAPARFVKPLKKGEQAASFSFGGPLIKFSGALIPIPFSTLAYGRGISDRVSIFGGLHTTSALFGNVQADAGTTVSILKKEQKWGLTCTPALQFITDPKAKRSTRLWPSIDLNYYAHFNQRESFMYGGVNMWIEPSAKRAHGVTQKDHLIPNLQLGYTFVRTKFSHQVELKYLGLGIPNLPGVVEYAGLAGRGSLGIYYNVIRKF